MHTNPEASSTRRARPTRRRIRWALCPLAGAAALWLAPAAQADVNFQAPNSFSVGSGPQSVAIDDFNGDGIPDLAVANHGSDSVSVLLGDGSGGFAAATDYAVSAAPTGVSVGDFNGDNQPDLAVADGGDVSVLLGDGNGDFAAPTNVSINGDATSIAVGDFDGDGNADVAVTDDVNNHVTVLLGDGTGGFGSRGVFDAGQRPNSVAVGDFNGDGNSDLAVASFASSTVTILLGDGTGGFGDGTDYTVGDNPESVAVGDLNGDGNPDLAVADNGSNTVSVLLGDGSGGFGSATDFAAGSDPVSVSIEDLDGDGNPDLAVADHGSDSVSVLLGDGSGGFGSATAFDAGSAPSSVATGDFDGDGNPDLAVADHGSDSVSVLLAGAAPASAPDAPTLTGTDPASPADDQTPDVTGTAPDGTTVNLYTSPDCSGDPVATGSADDLASGIGVLVPDDSDTTFYATATDQSGTTSDCSTSSVEYVEISSPPSPDIQVSDNPAMTGEAVTFDASGSAGPYITDYQWDLNGDGTFETDTGTDPTATRTYAHPGEVDVAVQVTNVLGYSDVTSVPVQILPGPPPGEPGVTINDGARYTNHRLVTLSLVWPAYTTTALVSNDGGFGQSQDFAIKKHIPWSLPSSAQDGVPSRVYVRFDGGNGPVRSDDIVLDQTNPVIASARLALASQHTYRLHVDATDTVSGVADMQVTRDKQNPGKWRRFRADSNVANHGNGLFVRVRDKAGNKSRWWPAR